MKLVKNKSSGRPFIVLDDTGGTRLLLLTPEGKVKRLERHLFGSLVAADHKELQWGRHLTKAQMDMYAVYDKDVDY